MLTLSRERKLKHYKELLVRHIRTFLWTAEAIRLSGATHVTIPQSENKATHETGRRGCLAPSNPAPGSCKIEGTGLCLQTGRSESTEASTTQGGLIKHKAGVYGLA